MSVTRLEFKATRGSSRAITRRDNAFSVVVVSIFCMYLAGFAALAVYWMDAPRGPVDPGGGNSFSLNRAMLHERAITRLPHPIGSAANVAVREYLTAQLERLGLETQVFRATGIYAGHKSMSVTAGITEDVLGRMRGSAHSGAILLAAHYDSVNFAPGAGDDGAAVAAILESLGCLRAGAALKNDVIVLFSDGEEAGLLGAEAFVSLHPWAKDVQLVMNFDARGTTGTPVLFQTSPGNASLIAGVKNALPDISGSSLLSALFARLPNDTDLSTFRNTRTARLNIAFLGSFDTYHSALDNVANLSHASLQSTGNYVLALTRYFGDRELTAFRSNPSDAVFFSLTGQRMLAYRGVWVIPLQTAVTVFLVAGLILFVKRHDVRVSDLAMGFLSCAGLMIVVALTAAAEWPVAKLLSGGTLASRDSTSNALFLVAMLVIAGSAGVVWLRWRVTRLSVGAIFAGGLLLLCVSSWVLTVAQPLASYMLFWPLLAATVPFTAVQTFLAMLRRRSEGGSILSGLLGPTLALMLAAQLMHLLFTALFLDIAVVLAGAVLVSVVLLLSAPALFLALPSGAGWAAPMLVPTVAALACAIWGIQLAGYTAAHPAHDDLLYSIDADAKQAAWISRDRSLDAWTAPILASHLHRGAMPGYLAGSAASVLSAPAPMLALDAPQVTVVSHTQLAGVHNIHLTARSPRSAPVLRFVFARGVSILAASICNRPFLAIANAAGGRSRWSVDVYGVRDSVMDIQLRLRAAVPLTFWAIDESPGLLPGVAARPAGLSAGDESDLTFVCRKYTL